MIKSIAIHYFDYWNSRNIEHLGELLTEDCRLQDWEIEIEAEIILSKETRKFLKNFQMQKFLFKILRWTQPILLLQKSA